MEPSADAVVARGPVLWRTVVDGVLVRRRGDDDTIHLTGSGRALWEALEEPAPLAEIVAALAAAHDTDVETVRADVGPVVADLLELGVLRRG